jgi:uncharacterized protein
MWRWVLCACLLPLAGCWLYFVALAGLAAGTWAYTAMKLLMIALPIAAVALTRESIALPVPPRRRRSALVGLLVGVLSAGALIGCALGPLSWILEAARPRIVDKIDSFGLRDHYLIASIFICVVHSALEEYYWRWFVYGALRRKIPEVSAHVMAALAFALHHTLIGWVYFGPALGLIAGMVVAAAGLTWSLVYRRSGSLTGGWIAHVCADAALMYLGWLCLSPAG